ncbi:LLM class flavin-dependent oxidoreductase [Saccharopolyspora sp. HNM0983]|uniref:LLM class flavin-dependent oxidoreductase n=1 Tax=Saccharopolyspora montiporae TaxID=2781240 RepID=A0A929B9X1_9PSEU|nr:LLM class flavin-dependent oxidoreductase [Saccharopolyspora sp. HNM0983]MBE9373707.1 LLM class flavin-dependent oxidoreductase [Saccharopolyspora sp. HNM0983]
MGDYGRALQFGVFLTPDAGAVDRALHVAEVADAHRLDLIGVQDHPYQKRFLDAWSLIATLLARTEHVHVFPDVASLPLRPPAVLAQAAASLDRLSGGRVELGLGAGAFWTAITAMGGPARTPGQAAAALIEAIRIIRAMWSGSGPVRVDGEHYRVHGAQPGPEPAHPIGLWLGVLGPRLLGEVGRSADGWVPSSGYVPPNELADKHARIDRAAIEGGRDPADIQRIYNVFGTITGGASRGFLHGPVRQWIDQLTELVLEYGMDTFVFGTDGDDPDQIRVFADEVVPAVRSLVTDERS